MHTVTQKTAPMDDSTFFEARTGYILGFIKPLILNNSNYNRLIQDPSHGVQVYNDLMALARIDSIFTLGPDNLYHIILRLTLAPTMQ